MADDDVLPFGLPADRLREASFALRLQTSKINAGYDELLVAGDGAVVLSRTASARAEPERLEGRAPVEAFVRLLDLLEGERFLEWDALYPGPHADCAAYILTLRLPAPDPAPDDPAALVPRDERPPVEKRVVAVMPTFEACALVIGAARVVAAQGRREALRRRFFARL